MTPAWTLSKDDTGNCDGCKYINLKWGEGACATCHRNPDTDDHFEPGGAE
jgi:hypothetical protein